MNKSKYIEFKNRSDEDEEEGSETKDKYLGYFTKQNVQTCYTIVIDEPIMQQSYYRQINNMINNTSEGDLIEFQISSPGGYLNGLTSILSALDNTEATSVAYINGECHSAASMLALSCDAVAVSDNATMLVHFASFGASGKGTDVKAKVDHTYDTCKELFQRTYLHFLTEEEMEKIIGGYELYLNSNEIKERLAIKQELLENNKEVEDSADI